MDNNFKDDKRIYTLKEEQPRKAVLKMGIPVTCGMLVMVLYNIVDTYFVGLLHDDYQLAATNLSYPIMMIMIAISGIVGNGGASYIARLIGGNKKEEAEHTLTIGFELIIICSILLSIIGIIFITPIVNLLGAKDNTFTYTKSYVLIMFIGSIFTMGNYAIGQLLRSEGSTFYSMIGMLSGTITNIILDPIFIFTFKLEIKGAAIATIIGNAVGLLLMLYYYIAGKTLLRPSINLLSFKKSIVKEIMLVGIPHTLEQFLSTAAIIINNNLAVAYGELTVAAMGVSNKIMSFGNYIYQGMAAGSQPLMGYNYGAGNYKRMKKLIGSAISITTIMELVIMISFYIFAPSLIGLFSNSPLVIEIGVKTLRAAIFILPFVGTTSIARNTFNAMGKPLYAFAITLVRQLVLYIPFLILFNKFWGYDGLIFAQPMEEALCMILSIILLLSKINSFEQKNKPLR